MLFEKAIKERIKSLRMAKSIKQSDFAKMINISQGAYSNIEGGDTELSIERLEKIAEALGVSVKYLLFGEEEYQENSNEEKIKNLERELEFLKMKMQKEEVLAKVYFNFFNNISNEEKKKAFNKMPKEIKAIFFTLIGVELIDWITKSNKDNNSDSAKGKSSKKVSNIDKSELPDDLDDYEKK